MYTPARRRDSVSEPVQKFTPSKRGQAALDALALGYDVQLPEYSFALLPRTSVSEQALSSRSTVEQLPRSTSLGDSHGRTGSVPKQHRHNGSDFAGNKRFVGQVQSPDSESRRSSINEDWILDFSTPQSSVANTADTSSRASTSSYQPSTSQYVLDSPRRTRRSEDSTHRENLGMGMPTSHTPRSMADISYQSSPVRHHSIVTHQTPGHLANRSQSQQKANTLIPAASATYDHEGFGRLLGTRLATRSNPRPAPLQSMAPLPEASSMERSLDAYFSPRNDEYHMDIQQLGGSAQYARIHSGISGTRSSHGQPYGPRPQPLKSPTWNASGARRSPVDRLARQPPEDGGFYGDFGPPRPHHHHSSSEPPVPFTSSRRNSRPQAGSQRPQLTPSSMLPPLPPFDASAASGRYVLSRPSLRVSTQPIPGSSIQPLRSAPLPSTSTSSRTTPLFHDDDEAFKVHPERAAVSRVETLLMLSSCQVEAQLARSGGIIRHPAMNIPPSGHDHPGYLALGPQMGPSNYQTLAYSNLLGLIDTKAQVPQEAPRDVGFKSGAVIPSQERSPTNRRPRQRSGSMGPSFSSPPQRPRQHNGVHRQRQRSASVIVQGLSPDAVKKLRMYEQLKYQDKGKPESLRAIVGCTAKYRVYGVRARKNTTSNSFKAPISPTQMPLPPSPILTLGDETSFRPLSPHNVPLPISPSQSPTLCTGANRSSPVVPSLISSDSFMRYRASQGIESPRPLRNRQNTISGRVIPTLRLISSPGQEDPQSETDVSPTDHAEASDLATTPSEGRASLKLERLKVDPQLERILIPTPPPAFWSPPHSAVVRTSAPLPLLPATNLSPSSPASISVPTTRTASAPPLRPMSVPPSGDPLRVGDSDDVRRVWSCQPATAELPPVKSFAGDWRQSMVIELSDEEEEEEEEEESTDTDFSELEDEEVDHCQVLDAGDVVVEGDMIPLPETKPNAINDTRMDIASQVKPVGNKATNKGITSSGMGSGVDAVEAVQHAIVKLALDNAEAAQSRRTLQTRAKRPAAPVRTGSVTAAYPPASHPFLRHSLDSERPRDLKPPHTLPNQYLGPISRAYRAPNPPVYSHTPTNLALESLRSGLELRAAASVSAVEEAVRARSASPSFPLQDGQPLAPRPNPGFVLPPRLQRLQSMHPRVTPSLPTPRLEIPALPSPRLDVPTLQQRRSSYESPRQPASPAVTLYPGTLSIPPCPVLPRQYPTTPLVHERNPLVLNVGVPQVEEATIMSRAPEASTSLNKSQLPNIVVDNKPVTPAPATAPLSRNHGERRRQTRRSAEAVLSSSKDSKVVPVVPAPAPAPVPPTPVPPVPPVTLAPEPAPGANTPSQTVASSPKPKQKGTRRRWVKHRKSPASEQIKAATPAPVPVPSTPVVPAPKPSERTSTPKKASVPPPKKASTPRPKNDPASASSPAPKDSSNSTPKPKRKHKPLKKHKSAKPGAALAPTVPS